MMNRLLVSFLSVILGTFVVYGIMKLDSFIYSVKNPEYYDMLNNSAALAIPDLGLVLLFFIGVLPYQFIAIIPLQSLLKRVGFSILKSSFVIVGISTLIYSLGFTIIFRSPYLGVLDTIQTFGFGVFVFGVYFLINLSLQQVLLKRIPK
ncbi:hypothetical protein [Algoriphagus aquimarinus]|uniref:Uncharacterized protein n=1 Tax=Algoriphagus aquimarinus TaxID=237018 RepID=A0A1I0YAN0_9BACT|nr:hypothetical protein [Algoriphagus aquimarinus]SFB10344.1 hypothetical protein SAMN04489723_104213 [Algoriphagus aquimarinus]